MPAGASGWNPNRDAVQHFALHSLEKQSETGTSPQTCSILLIEDNPSDARLVLEALEQHSVAGELVVISDGEKAIRYIQALPEPADCPNLLIIDLNLPRRPGREVLRATRQSPACAGATIAILSSSDAQQDRLDAMAFGADRYIRKPLRLEEFLKLGGIFKEMLETQGGKPD